VKFSIFFLHISVKNSFIFQMNVVLLNFLFIKESSFSQKY